MNEPLSYRHHQVGWALPVSLLLPVPILWFTSRLSGSLLPLGVGIPMVVVSVALFGSLTVEVDRTILRLRLANLPAYRGQWSRALGFFAGNSATDQRLRCGRQPSRLVFSRPSRAWKAIRGGWATAVYCCNASRRVCSDKLRGARRNSATIRGIASCRRPA